MTIGVLPDAVKPRIHCVRTPWDPGFHGVLPVRHARTVGASDLNHIGHHYLQLLLLHYMR